MSVSDCDSVCLNDSKVFKLGKENGLGIGYGWYAFDVKRSNVMGLD